MALRTSRIVRKYAPFYSKVRDSEDSDSEGGMRSSAAARSSPSSFRWLHRALSSGLTHHARVVVPLSESPSRELRMRSATKARRPHHDHHSKKQKKHFPRLWW